jgi:hypothetical protein
MCFFYMYFRILSNINMFQYIIVNLRFVICYFLFSFINTFFVDLFD